MEQTQTYPSLSKMSFHKLYAIHELCKKSPSARLQVLAVDGQIMTATYLYSHYLLYHFRCFLWASMTDLGTSACSFREHHPCRCTSSYLHPQRVPGLDMPALTRRPDSPLSWYIRSRNILRVHLHAHSLPRTMPKWRWGRRLGRGSGDAAYGAASISVHPILVSVGQRMFYS